MGEIAHGGNVAGKTEDEIREALREVLAQYGVTLEDELGKSTHIENNEEISSDYGEIVSKTQQKLDDLNEQAEEIFKRTGMTREQLEAYAANSANFTPEQWESLQKVKEACERYKHEARARIGEDELEKRVERKLRKKQPHRFAKKKNWIPL